ncbi:fimbria/pilus outer membrane usher protein [Cupriavidus pauculus]|uniref:fimbria/pilus outer membrane usher protein n=1 Tax=Cupriavidus pauculus TaxID=82633 RepID=UPI001FD36795|nr:fimbria/pilus outer membrane usher protein [Cupriavidus pauculus]
MEQLDKKEIRRRPRGAIGRLGLCNTALQLALLAFGLARIFVLDAVAQTMPASPEEVREAADVGATSAPVRPGSQRGDISEVGQAASAAPAERAAPAEPTEPTESTKTTEPAEPTAAVAPKGFDLDMMKSRGIDPRIADYFMHGARFTPGMSLVTFKVNGKSKGSGMARFDDEGQLCFDARLVARLGLRMPGDDAVDRKSASPQAPAPDAAGSCLDFKGAWPATVITLKPSSSAVDLLVPTDALRIDAVDQVDYTTGGVAALLNYDLLATGSRFDGGSTRYFSAANEFGFNAGDWIVRNRNTYSNDGNTSNFSHLYAYAQRTFVERESVFQAGEINVGNSIFPGPAITGAQWIPELALKRSTGNGTSIDGIAQTQARVEVRQAGALIYNTMVPPGPFTLSNVPLLNGSNDVEVTVIEANGAARKFVVPAAQLNAGSLGIAPGYSFAVGKLRQLGDETPVKPWMATGTGTWRAGKNVGLTGGLMFGTQYQSVGAGADARVFKNSTNVSLRGLFSNATRQGERGAQLTGSLSSTIGNGFSVNASATQQTEGYRSLTDTTQETTSAWVDNHYRSQYSAGISWSQQLLGGVTISYSRSTLFTNVVTQRVTASWGKSFKYATVSINAEKSLGGDGENNGNSIYASVSIPLGRRSVRGYVNRVQGETRIGATYNEAVNDGFSYSVNAEGRPSEGSAAASATASMTPYYTHLNLGVSQYGSSSTSYNVGMNGGLVAHKHGVTFSPYAVGDTFGIASLGDVQGIKISTPQGPVWTDPWGQAVISNEPAYTSSRVEVATKSLPRNIDITNAFRQINPGRGSVTYVDFDVVKVRRLLLHAVDTEGKPLPRNATVTDASGTFLTTVLNDGTIFLPNTQAAAGMKVQSLDGKSCVLDFALPEVQDLNAYFDEANAVCRPADPSKQGATK